MEVKDMLVEELMLKAQEILNEIDRRVEESEGKVRHYNRLMNEAYHEIERSKYDAFKGYKAYAELREILRQRRVVKREQRALFGRPNSAHSNDRELRKIAKQFSRILYINGVTQKAVDDNDEWSNNDELGRIKYSEIDQEYNKKFGSLEDALTILSNNNSFNVKTNVDMQNVK